MQASENSLRSHPEWARANRSTIHPDWLKIVLARPDSYVPRRCLPRFSHIFCPRPHYLSHWPLRPPSCSAKAVWCIAVIPKRKRVFTWCDRAPYQVRFASLLLLAVPPPAAAHDFFLFFFTLSSFSLAPFIQHCVRASMLRALCPPIFARVFPTSIWAGIFAEGGETGAYRHVAQSHSPLSKRSYEICHIVTFVFICLFTPTKQISK